MPIKSLFLVDDDEDDHELFKLALHEFVPPVSFAGAENGMAALKMLDSNTASPDFIFLDINMPILNGFEFLRQLKRKKHLEHIPVVMYSTSDSPYDEQQALELGAIAYLRKPSTLSELGQILESFFGSFREE
jgi:CheY-like chemotaxis protein